MLIFDFVMKCIYRIDNLTEFPDNNGDEILNNQNQVKDMVWVFYILLNLEN